MACLVALACNRPPAAGDSAGENEASEASEAGPASATASGDTISTETSSSETTDNPDCGGAFVLLEDIPVAYTVVVDRSAASERPFDHDNDPATPDRTPRQLTDEILEKFVDEHPVASECSGRWPGLVVIPGASVPDPVPGSACATDFDTTAPSPNSLSEIETSLPLPAAQGGSPMRAGLERAFELTAAATVPKPEGIRPVVIVLLGGPAGCGDGETPAVLDLDPLAGVPDFATVALLPVGPMTGITPGTNDGSPSGVDLAGYWQTLLADPRVTMVPPGVDDLSEWLFWCGQTAQPGARCGLISACSIDLTMPPNSPPDDISLVEEVIVNGESLSLLDADVASCESGDAGRGFIWVTPLEEILLCLDDCKPFECRDHGAGTYGRIEMEIPYLCPDG